MNRGVRPSLEDEAWVEEMEAPREPGRVNLWLRLTSSGWDQPQRTIEDRDRVRRSRLTSWIILGLFVVALILAVASIGETSSLAAALGAVVGLVIIAIFNRVGWVTAAGLLLVLLLTAVVMSALISEPNGLLYLDALPGYDLLTIGVVVAASVLPRAMAFVVALFNSGLIVVDFYLQPHHSDLTADLTNPNSYPSPTAGILSILLRPIALQLIIAIIAYLWVRGTEDAIRRADRAEELAAMEHQMVEQRRQLDVGIQQILQTHIRVANGDFSARAPLTQDNLLFQIASSLNNLVNRLGRAAQSQFQLQRTVQEIGRLRDSLLAARSGRPPLWPVPSGTPVDALIEVIAGPERNAAAIQPPIMPGGGMIGGPSGPLGGGSGRLGPAPASGPNPGGFGPGGGPQGWRPDQAPFGQPGFGAPGPTGQTGMFGPNSGGLGAAPSPFGQPASFGQPAPIPFGQPEPIPFGQPAPAPFGGQGPAGAPPFGPPEAFAGGQGLGTPSGPSGPSGPSWGHAEPAAPPPDIFSSMPPAADGFGNADGAFAAPQPPASVGSGGNGVAPASQTTGSWDMPPLPDWLNADDNE